MDISGWPELQEELDKPYMQELSAFLREERQADRPWYPVGVNIFRALESVALNEIRLVIVGQDPYHGAGQAMGMCFSVPNELTPKPPSLTNIFKEIESECGGMPRQSDLSPWACASKVLLLNAVLTVGAGRANSHAGKGWETFTDRVIQLISEKREHVVFLLWGRYAQVKGAQVDRSRHLVLESVHPSPLSANKGFFGCGHFKTANSYLLSHGQEPIDWLMAKS